MWRENAQNALYSRIDKGLVNLFREVDWGFSDNIDVDNDGDDDPLLMLFDIFVLVL